MMSRGIMVFSEQPELRRELLGKARQLANETKSEVSLCVSGGLNTDYEVYAAQGADVIYSLSGQNLAAAEYSNLLALAVAKFEPALILIGATKMGMEIAPRVAEQCQASYAAWAVEAEIDSASGLTTARCMLYAGTGLAEYRFSLAPTVLSVAPGVFEGSDLEGRTAVVVALELAPELPRLTVIAERKKPLRGTRLEEARVIVDIGRGVKNPEDLGMIRELAALLDGQVSCSRPVSSDRDWFAEWLGLSGAKVKPELCLTIGVSGAIQHVVGIRDSRIIAAINRDEDAAIFAQADIGVVADLNELVPVLIERLRARGAQSAWLQD